MGDIITRIQNMQAKRQTKKQILNEVSKSNLDRKTPNTITKKTKH